MNNVVIVSGRQQRHSAIQKYLSIQRAGLCLLIEFRIIFSLTFSLQIRLLLFDAHVFPVGHMEGAPGIYVCPQFPFLGISRPCGEAVKNLPIMQIEPRDMDSIPESGRSPEGRNANPLQYSYQENPMDREAWWATVHGVTNSQTCQHRCTCTRRA